MTLQKLRKAKNMTQAELAQVAGINLRTLQDYEQGHKDINAAKLTTLVLLTKALECDLTDIITNENLIQLIKENHPKLK